MKELVAIKATFFLNEYMFVWYTNKVRSNINENIKI